MKKIAAGMECVCVEMCVAYIRRSGRQVIYESGNGLVSKNHCASEKAMREEKTEDARLWFAAAYPDICLKYCHGDLSISSFFKLVFLPR